MASPHAESFYCISETNLGLDERRIYTGTCIGCAALGLGGSFMQVLSLHRLWKYSPGSTARNTFTPNVSVIFFLAVADMLACFSVIVRSGTLAVITPPYDDGAGGLIPASQLVVDIGAPIQSFLQFFFLASYFWTFIFALDIYLQLTKKTSPSNISYHVFTWLAAAVLTGFSEFIVFYDIGLPCADGLRVTLAHMATYVPIVFVMLGNPILYILAYNKLKVLMRRQGVFGHNQHKLMSHVTRKFLAYVAVFWICWLPSIATGVYLQVIGVDEKFPFSLWMLTAVLNPLQGFFNCFIYGVGQRMVGSLQIVDASTRTASNRVVTSPLSEAAPTNLSTSIVTSGKVTQYNPLSLRDVSPLSERAPLLSSSATGESYS